MSGRLLADVAALRAFADEFLRGRPQGACVGLTGDLGAGKTTFVRACVESLCRSAGMPAPRVVSPSYVIHQSYRKLSPPVEHYDLYRMESAGFEALVDMGYFEAVAEARARHGFVFVEWPERAGEALLQLDTRIDFAIENEGRRLTISDLRP